MAEFLNLLLKKQQKLTNISGLALDGQDVPLQIIDTGSFHRLFNLYRQQVHLADVIMLVTDGTSGSWHCHALEILTSVTNERGEFNYWFRFYTAEFILVMGSDLVLKVKNDISAPSSTEL